MRPTLWGHVPQCLIASVAIALKMIYIYISVYIYKRSFIQSCKITAINYLRAFK